MIATALLGCGDATPPARAVPPITEIPVDPAEAARPAAPATAAPDASAVARAAPATRFLDHPEALRRFFAALSALEKRQRADDVRVIQFGDSHTAADYETGPMRRALQHRFGDGGRGFVAIGRPWKPYTQEGIHLTGMTGWTAERPHLAKGKLATDGDCGLLGVAIATSKRGARAWSDLTADASRIELAYLEQPRGGSFDVLVDGKSARHVRTAGAEAKSAYVALDVPEGPHRVDLEAAGDGVVRFFGATLDSPKAGLTLDALGVNGARAGDLLRANEEHFAGELRHRDPSLVVLAFGTNESVDAVPLDAYERQIVDVLGRVARAVPAASCLLLGPPDRAEKHRVVVPAEAPGGKSSLQTVWTTAPRILEVAAMERKVAAAAGCAYWSQLDAMGGPGSIAGWATETPPRAMLDRTHLSRQGYAELGEAFAGEIVQAYEASRGAPQMR